MGNESFTQQVFDATRKIKQKIDDFFDRDKEKKERESEYQFDMSLYLDDYGKILDILNSKQDIQLSEIPAILRRMTITFLEKDKHPFAEEVRGNYDKVPEFYAADFADFANVPSTFKDYLNKQAKDYSWASITELRALANILAQFNIKIIYTRYEKIAEPSKMPLKDCYKIVDQQEYGDPNGAAIHIGLLPDHFFSGTPADPNFKEGGRHTPANGACFYSAVGQEIYRLSLIPEHTLEQTAPVEQIKQAKPVAKVDEQRVKPQDEKTTRAKEKEQDDVIKSKQSTAKQKESFAATATKITKDYTKQLTVYQPFWEIFFNAIINKLKNLLEKPENKKAKKVINYDRNSNVHYQHYHRLDVNSENAILAQKQRYEELTGKKWNDEGNKNSYFERDPVKRKQIEADYQLAKKLATEELRHVREWADTQTKDIEKRYVLSSSSRPRR